MIDFIVSWVATGVTSGSCIALGEHFLHQVDQLAHISPYVSNFYDILNFSFFLDSFVFSRYRVSIKIPDPSLISCHPF